MQKQNNLIGSFRLNKVKQIDYKKMIYLEISKLIGASFY